MNILCVKETCIYVTDLERTKDFYANKLKLTVISIVNNRHVFFKAGSSVLLCFLAKATEKENLLPPHGAQGSIHVAFEVSKEEYPFALLQIKNAGIEILHQHVWGNDLHSFYFHDPDQNLVEIIEQGLWEQ